MPFALPITIRIDEEADLLVRESIRDAIALCLAYGSDDFEHLDEVKDMVEKAPGYPGHVGQQLLAASYPRGYVAGYVDTDREISEENRLFLKRLMGVADGNIDVDGRFDDTAANLLAAAETGSSDPEKSGLLVDGVKEQLTRLYETGLFYGTKDAKLHPIQDVEERITEFREGIERLRGNGL